MKGLRPDEITVALRDANQLADLLPIVEQTLESVSLKSPPQPPPPASSS